MIGFVNTNSDKIFSDVDDFMNDIFYVILLCAVIIFYALRKSITCSRIDCYV